MDSSSQENQDLLAKMEQWKANSDLLYKQYEIIENTIHKLQDILNEIFVDINHPGRQFAVQQMRELINQWTTLVQMQRGFLNKMEQDTLINSIEITGLPEEFARNKSEVAQILANILHICILEGYVTGFERLGNVVENGPPRPLVVHLVNENIKKRILTIAESIDVSAIGSDVPIEIMEHLTNYNKQLLKKAREEAPKHGVNNVWVKDGKIFFSRDENSSTYEVKNEADLNKMSQP